MTRRIRFLHRLSAVSFVLGLILSAPGLLLLIGAALIQGLAVDRELEAR
jgi:hypothetical protein